MAVSNDTLSIKGVARASAKRLDLLGLQLYARVTTTGSGDLPTWIIVGEGLDHAPRIVRTVDVFTDDSKTVAELIRIVDELEQAEGATTASANASQAQDRPSTLTRGEVNRAYAFACAARATLCEFAESNPDSVGDSGAQIAIELLNLIEDVLMENEGGTPAGRGFERSTAREPEHAQ